MANPFVGMTKEEKICLGRRRILCCVAHLGEGCARVDLQDLQKLYLRAFERNLNREEYRCLFGYLHAKSIFQKFMADKIQLSTDEDKNGSMYFYLKSEFKEAIGEECPEELVQCVAEALAAQPHLMGKYVVQMPVADLWGQGDNDEEKQDEDEALAQNGDGLLKGSAAKMAAADEKKALMDKAMNQSAVSLALHQGGPSFVSIGQQCLRRAMQRKKARLPAMQKITDEKKVKEEEEDNEIGLEERQPNKKKQPPVVTKMMRRLAAMPDEEEGTESNKAVVGRAVENKFGGSLFPYLFAINCANNIITNDQLRALDHPAASKICMNSNIDEEENPFTYEEATTEDEADNSGKITKEILLENAGEGAVEVEKRPMPTAAEAQSAMPEALVAAITLVMNLEYVYKAQKLHEKLDAAFADYSVHFPSVHALVQFVRQSCNTDVKVEPFDGKNAVFLLNTTSELELDRLCLKVGRSLNAAANNSAMQAFKEKILAAITIFMKMEYVYKAQELHAKLPKKFNAAEYSAHFPSVHALVQFVRQNCNFVKVEAFDEEEIFLLDTKANAELDRLLQVVGKSLMAAASK